MPPSLLTQAPQVVGNGELRLHTTIASLLPPTLQVTLESGPGGWGEGRMGARKAEGEWSWQ